MSKAVVPVAVLIPARDYGQYIREALDSLAAQTVLPADVLVIDDGSVDDTPARLADAIEALPDLRLRVVRHDHPRGFVASLVEGTALTDAPLIAHVDADDRVLPRYLESLVEALETHPDAGYAYPRVRLFGGETGVVLSGPFNAARLVYDGNYIPHIGIVRRTAYEATRGYRDLPSRADWDLWLSFLAAGFGGVFVDEVLYEWRRHQASMTLSEPVRSFARARVQLGHPGLLVRYLLPGIPHLVRSAWRRVRIRIPIGNPPYGRTASCWIEMDRGQGQ
jgi:glycosyltransferase involved in cell wall biosynthesis